MNWIIIIIWVALGIHSAYYLVKCYTKQYDFTKNQIWMIGCCILFPIVTHFATWTIYSNVKNDILWSKKK